MTPPSPNVRNIAYECKDKIFFKKFLDSISASPPKYNHLSIVPFIETSSKSVHNFSSYFANQPTEKHTVPITKPH